MYNAVMITTFIGFKKGNKYYDYA